MLNLIWKPETVRFSPLCQGIRVPPGAERDVPSSSVHSHLLGQIYSQPQGKLQLQPQPQLQGILFACLLGDLFVKIEFHAPNEWGNLLRIGVKQ